MAKTPANPAAMYMESRQASSGLIIAAPIGTAAAAVRAVQINIERMRLILSNQSGSDGLENEMSAEAGIF